MRIIQSIISVMVLLLLDLSATGADTNAPTAWASCFNGRTIGVCFSEVVDPVSAANLANYRIFPLNIHGQFTGEWEYFVTSAELRPDQQSVSLQLNKVYPSSLFKLVITNVQDLAGNSRLAGGIARVHNLELNDIGNPGIDPNERGGIFNCIEQTFEVTAGGSGLGGTNDSLTFVSRPWRTPSLFMEAQVAHLEPVNRFTSAGLMVREDFSAGARFFSIMITPPDSPVQDGSGNGLNRARVLYRDQKDGPVVEVPVASMPRTNSLLEISRGGNIFAAGIDSTAAAQITFAEGFPDSSFIGLAVSSYNNSPGFSADAIFTNYRLRISDRPPSPVLNIKRNINDLMISWTELHDIQYFLLESPDIGAEFWHEVTNRTMKVQRSAEIWDATTTIPVKAGQGFYSLRFSRY